MRRSLFFLIGLLLLSAGRPLRADAPALKIDGYLQFWYLYEQAENGKRQSLTGDLGAQAASGFSLNRARIGTSLELGAWKAALQLRLEGGSIGLLDAYGAWQPFGPALELRVGQMKIPSAWEAMVGDDALDFTTRSRFANEVANWSLSKSSNSTSPLYAVQTYSRDLGLGLAGYLSGFRYFLMVGNGLGANSYIGAEENRQFIFANDFGAYFYAVRLSYDLLYELRQWIRPIPIYLEVGGHFDYNHHPNLIYNDGTTVLDLERWSWSADARLRLFERLRLTGMYGAGTVADDFDNDGRPDYQYSGWELSAIAAVVPRFLEAGVRWDVYSWNRAVTSGWSTAATLTAGLTWNCNPHVRVQLNYRWKLTLGDLAQDTANDIAILALQLRS
jgi:opacity protein-like surface antigen